MSNCGLISGAFSSGGGSGGVTTVVKSITGITANQTTTSTILTDCLGTSSVVVSTVTNGKMFATFSAVTANTGLAAVRSGVHYDGADQEITQHYTCCSGAYASGSVGFVMDLDGDTCQTKWSVASDTGRMHNDVTGKSEVKGMEVY